jgi:hypothetical protein
MCSNIALALREVVNAHALLQVVLILAIGGSASKALSSAVIIIMKSDYSEERLETCVTGSYDWIVIFLEEPLNILNILGFR